MNRIILTGLAALALTAVQTTQAAVSVVIRPTLAYVNPEADGYDDTAYVGVAAGVVVDEKGQHEFTGEIGATGWDFDEHQGPYRIKGDETYIPVLASYRFYFHPVESKFRVFVSPSVGFTQASYEAESSGPGIFFKDDSTEVLFTMALSAGAEFRLTDKLSISAGYRYLFINGGETELFGQDIDLDDAKAHVVFAALGIRF